MLGGGLGRSMHTQHGRMLDDCVVHMHASAANLSSQARGAGLATKIAGRSGAHMSHKTSQHADAGAGIGNDQAAPAFLRLHGAE